MSFVTADEFSVRVKKVIGDTIMRHKYGCLLNSQPTFLFLTYFKSMNQKDVNQITLNHVTF